ncbi:hypothetical protein [Actinoplanes sp. URMC 104]|uniref:hypothetical protein n=1 Tax=Actinoplanes sp. URMC 104 TaxID=3423409 RepID=UPI003F1A35D4
MKKRWIAAGVAVLLAVAGGLAYAYPSVAATTCPRCYGLREVGDGVYGERHLTAAQREQLTTLAAAARERVGDFYGGRESDPRLVTCFTDRCYRRIGGGGERGIAVLDRAVMLSPRGLDVVIASHELAHVELHARLDGEVPQWFDEGLAVVVSQDQRYLGEHCRASLDGPLPETLSAWLSAASADEQVYARAACRVDGWLDANGGPPAVLDLVDRLDHGEPFPAALR